ncbi:MAG: sigma-54-dependent Fis family transcriptional regulator, partial [Proteobacteria bacterium]|nr:sigma-54-dependent Fis family transcriptional regulator [Pseudomonadota bacterium]
MRVLIIGTLDGHVSTAAKIAKNRGATVTLVDSIDAALINLRIGRGADIILIDLKLPVSELIESLEAERFIIPVVSCGIGASPQDAADTIKAGAKEYLPLPPDPELIAAIFEAVAQENHAFIFKDPAMLHWVN